MTVVTEKRLDEGIEGSTIEQFDVAESVTVRHIMACVANLATDGANKSVSRSEYLGFVTVTQSDNAIPQNGSKQLGSVEMPDHEGTVRYTISEPMKGDAPDPFALKLEVAKDNNEPRVVSQFEAEELLSFLEKFTPIRQLQIPPELHELARTAYSDSQRRLQNLRRIVQPTLPLPDTFYEQ